MRENERGKNQKGDLWSIAQPSSEAFPSSKLFPLPLSSKSYALYFSDEEYLSDILSLSKLDLQCFLEESIDNKPQTPFRVAADRFFR